MIVIAKSKFKCMFVRFFFFSFFSVGSTKPVLMLVGPLEYVVQEKGWKTIVPPISLLYNHARTYWTKSYTRKLQSIFTVIVQCLMCILLHNVSMRLLLIRNSCLVLLISHFNKFFLHFSFHCVFSMLPQHGTMNQPSDFLFK